MKLNHSCIQVCLIILSYFLVAYGNETRTVGEMSTYKIKNFFYSNLFMGTSKRIGLYSKRSLNEGILIEATDLNINRIQNQSETNFIVFYQLEEAYLFTDKVSKVKNILGKALLKK